MLGVKIASLLLLALRPNHHFDPNSSYNADLKTDLIYHSEEKKPPPWPKRRYSPENGVKRLSRKSTGQARRWRDSSFTHNNTQAKPQPRMGHRKHSQPNKNKHSTPTHAASWGLLGTGGESGPYLTPLLQRTRSGGSSAQRGRTLCKTSPSSPPAARAASPRGLGRARPRGRAGAGLAPGKICSPRNLPCAEDASFHPGTKGKEEEKGQLTMTILKAGRGWSSSWEAGESHNRLPLLCCCCCGLAHRSKYEKTKPIWALENQCWLCRYSCPSCELRRVKERTSNLDALHGGQSSR